MFAFITVKRGQQSQTFHAHISEKVICKSMTILLTFLKHLSKSYKKPTRKQES